MMLRGTSRSFKNVSSPVTIAGIFRMDCKSLEVSLSHSGIVFDVNLPLLDKRSVTLKYSKYNQIKAHFEI